MKVTFTDGRVFAFDPAARLTNVEAMALERVTGLVGIKEFNEKMKAGWTAALTAMVWVQAKRIEPTLRFDEVDFYFDDLDVSDLEVKDGAEVEALTPAGPTPGDQVDVPAHP